MFHILDRIGASWNWHGANFMINQFICETSPYIPESLYFDQSVIPNDFFIYVSMPNRPPVYLLICWLSLSACLPDCLCLLTCLPDCLCQPTHPTVCLHVPLSLSSCLSIYLSSCLSACLPPDYLSTCLPTCFPTVFLSARVFVCLSYCLPASSTLPTLVPLPSLPVIPSAWPVVFPSGRMSK